MPRVYARLDRIDMHGDDRFLGKPWRKLRERIGGYSQRVRGELNLRPAAVIASLRDREPIQQKLILALPSNLEPGLYNLRILSIWEERTHREHVKDLAYNQDSYSGPVIATLEVLP
jgi:hypothetical protein